MSKLNIFRNDDWLVYTGGIMAVLSAGVLLGMVINGKSNLILAAADLITAFGTILLGIAALRGVSEWRRQHIASHQAIIARKLLPELLNVIDKVTLRNHILAQIKRQFESPYSAIKGDIHHHIMEHAKLINSLENTAADLFKHGIGSSEKTTKMLLDSIKLVVGENVEFNKIFRKYNAFRSSGLNGDQKLKFYDLLDRYENGLGRALYDGMVHRRKFLVEHFSCILWQVNREARLED